MPGNEREKNMLNRQLKDRNGLNIVHGKLRADFYVDELYTDERKN